MSDTNNSLRFRLDNVRVAFPTLFKGEQFNGEGKFRCGAQLLLAPDEDRFTELARSAFTLTIRGQPVAMTVQKVMRQTREGGREVFWSTLVGTKAAGLRPFDHHHSGNSRMEAVGWTLEVLASQDMEPSAMTWDPSPPAESALPAAPGATR